LRRYTHRKDFANHIKGTIDCDPEATRWHIVVDGLNTHKSETLARMVAKHEDLDIDLGIKGKHGILKINDDTHCFFE
jgi:putative transposase